MHSQEKNMVGGGSTTTLNSSNSVDEMNGSRDLVMVSNGNIVGHSNSSRENQIVYPTNECAGCGKSIKDKFLLKSMDKLFHTDCLTCNCCSVKLAEQGASLYFKAGLILCRRDYYRMFGSSGFCSACNKEIQPYEFVMRSAKPNLVFHLNCFSCSLCNYRFCVGDRYYVENSKILCEYDHQERQIFRQMAQSPNLAILNNTTSNNVGRRSGPLSQHQQNEDLQQHRNFYNSNRGGGSSNSPPPTQPQQQSLLGVSGTSSSFLISSSSTSNGENLEKIGTTISNSQISSRISTNGSGERKQFIQQCNANEEGACSYGSPDSGIRMDADYN